MCSLIDTTTRRQIKLKKDGSRMWTEVHELAALLRSGLYTWYVHSHTRILPT